MLKRRPFFVTACLRARLGNCVGIYARLYEPCCHAHYPTSRPQTHPVAGQFASIGCSNIEGVSPSSLNARMSGMSHPLPAQLFLAAGLLVTATGLFQQNERSGLPLAAGVWLLRKSNKKMSRFTANGSALWTDSSTPTSRRRYRDTFLSRRTKKALS